MHGIARHGGRWGLLPIASILAAAALLVAATIALAISAPIHIANTGGEGVFIRPEPNTSHPAVGWIPEGASPDYHCFAWGQDINGVPIWFNVTYNGKTGYYASYFDDSSYHSNEELTAKYGVPLCGSSPPPASPPSAPGPSTPSPPAPSSPPALRPAPAALYFSPYGPGKFEVGDGSTVTLRLAEWDTHCDSSHPRPAHAYEAALSLLQGTPVSTLAGWSVGRVGVISFLASATDQQLRELGYILLIDPGSYGEMQCDRERNAGGVLAHWLRVNTSAHLVVISGSHVSQLEGSKGIQETYFNAIRRYGASLNPRVLTCNYPITHQQAFWSSKYWIQHQIGSTRNACPWLSVSGHYVHPTAGWHPIN